MKTAMQELYAEIEKFKGINDTISITYIQRMIGNYYIEIEKKQIFDAHYGGQKIEDTAGFSDADYYYNSTFGDNPEAGI